MSARYWIAVHHVFASYSLAGFRGQAALSRALPPRKPPPSSQCFQFPGFGCRLLVVGCWIFGVFHKPSEFNSPSAPPTGWSGGTLDMPWTCPGTIEPSQTLVIDQPILSKSLSCGFPATSPASVQVQSRRNSGGAFTAELSV